MDLEPQFHEMYEQVRSYTGVEIARCYSLYEAARHVVANSVPGAFVECGVYRGGSSMVAALAFKQLDDLRQLYLYDTFTGFSEPTERDVSIEGKSARAQWRAGRREDRNEWGYAPLESVKRNMRLTGYPEDRIIYVPGKVEDTIPDVVPEAISILRLDTDFYESTYHELIHLYPLLQPGGVLYLDDYGSWMGARQAVDQYFSERPSPILLHRLSGGSRIGVKPQASHAGT